ncbi:MAG: hypothetical protein IMF10_01950 [Proteobacteria bacterium]|nr:hypothetical protein [Pseudomonadota bacterium]
MYFNPSQISLVNGTFDQAEKLAVTYFCLSHEEMKAHRYEVKTLEHLEDHEIVDRAFAHLCKYDCQKGKDKLQFFRICLQDSRILDAVERANSFIKLIPLMLYIATHELVHVVRFSRGEGDFDAPLEEKMKEEERVHYITRNILKPVADPDLKLVIDCFRNQYDIGDIFN